MMNNICGWGTSSQHNKIQKSNHIIIPSSIYNKSIYQTNNLIKISVKNSDHPIYDKNHITNQGYTQSITHHQFQPSYSINSTQATHLGSTTQPQQFPTQFATNFSLKQSIVERLNQRSPKANFPTKKRDVSTDYMSCMLKPTNPQQPKQALLRSRSPSPRQQFSSKPQNPFPQSYSNLLKQNIQLKRIIDQQYKPLKKLYQKLKQQHFDRQYLISQLQWKIKQLAKQIKSNKNLS